MKDNSDILFLTATHGDEGFAVPVLKKLEKEFPRLHWLIANERAFEGNVRFVDKDLNRCAPGNLNSAFYEIRRASELLKIAKRHRFVIDIHGTVSTSGIFVLVPDPTPPNIALAASLPITNVVIWAARASEKSGPITQFVKCGMEIECGPKDSPNVRIQLRKILRDLLSNKFELNPVHKQNWFRVYGKVAKEKTDARNLRDFEQAKVDEEVFYPLLVGQYKDIACYKMKQVSFWNLLAY